MGAVGGAEGVVYIAIGEGSQFLCKGGIIFLFFCFWNGDFLKKADFAGFSSRHTRYIVVDDEAGKHRDNVFSQYF